MADAGWYADPHDPRSQQYFDGRQWTGDRRPAPAPGPPPRSPWEPPPGAWNPPGQPPPEQVPPQPTAWQPAPAPSPAPAAPWQPAGQPGWQPPPQPGGWQPAAPTSGWPPAAPPAAPAGAWQPPAQPLPWQPSPPTASPNSRKRGPLLIALVATVAVVAGLLTWLLWPGDAAPTITYQGKAIASAGDVLTTAEANVAALVTKRHGAKSDQTRCYFAQPKKPASGDKKTDIDPNLRCGPVLFVDGSPADSYLSIPLTGTSSSGGKAALTSAGSLDGIDPAAVGDTVTLIRPDGKKAPTGSGGLAVPEPPAADRDVLTATGLGPTSKPPDLGGAVIVGRDTRVTLRAAGEITRYGQGDDARSAPAGQNLVAFQVTYGSGDLSGSGSARAAVVVDGGTVRQVPAASGPDQWVVLAVPAAGHAVLRLVDGGFTQTLSLPAGKPGSTNIAVLTRTHRTALVGKTATVPIHLSASNGSANVTFRASASVASLDFWVPSHETVHPSDPRHAILSIRLNYVDSAAPGKTFGFDPPLLRLRLPSGGIIRARNIASGNKIDDVFEVPATFTSGTVEITGSEKVGTVTVRVTKTKTIAVKIPAG